MLSCAVVSCVALYILPVFAALAARSSRSTSVWQIAITIPAVVAIDMLVVMTLARFMRLETAILLSRPAWVLAMAIRVVWRWRSRGDLPRWPRALRIGPVVATLAAAVIAFELSAIVSRPYHLWDRHWHVPLVTLFRAERMPFDNAYDPGRVLHYHLTGDVLGAMFQTLSFGIANASLALSVAHDVMFALVAATATLLMFGFGFRRVWPAPFAAVAILLQGPWSMRGKIGAEFFGYSFDNLLLVGFRPHVLLAGLLIVGVVGCVAVRVRWNGRVRSIHTTPALLACGTLLGITDEASTGIIGLALGAAWCISPQTLARSRLAGLAVLGTLGLAIVAAHWVFSGSLSPGGPVQAVEWVAARSPGSLRFAALPLESRDGRLALFFDLLPMLLCLLGLTLAASRPPRAIGALVFVWAVLIVSVVLFTRLEVNHTPSEAQRFMIAPSFVILLLGLLQVAREPSGSLASAAVAAGLALAGFSTVAWLSQRLTDCDNERAALQHPNSHTLDCREGTAARLGETASAAYFDAAIFGAYAGCHPSYAAGGVDVEWGIKFYPHLPPLQQLEELGQELVPPDRDLVAICARPPSSDRLCIEAERRGRCGPQGTEMRRCVLTPAERQAVLALLRGH